MWPRMFMKNKIAGKAGNSQTGRKFRNEWKYLISEWQQYEIRVRLKEIMQSDSHAKGGSYMIRSLYFDDYWDSAYHEKMMGISCRSKYRIRVYNCSDRTIKLERKIKVANYIHKDSAAITREELEQILDGDYAFLLSHPQELCREFYYECMAKVMRPRVIVDYEREPFICPYGDVRVTFDSHVRAGLLTDNIFDESIPAIDALDPGILIMEVKFTEFLPQAIREVLPPSAHHFTAVSKYTLCYEKTAYMAKQI